MPVIRLARGSESLPRYYFDDYEEEIFANGKPAQFIILAAVPVCRYPSTAGHVYITDEEEINKSGLYIIPTPITREIY